MGKSKGLGSFGLLKHLPKEFKYLLSDVKPESEVSRCIQTRNNEILEWDNCKTLYNVSGRKPDLSYVSYLDLKLSSNIFKNDLIEFIENKNNVKMLHLDCHDWDTKQTILNNDLWDDVVKFTHDLKVSKSKIYLEILNKPLKVFRKNNFEKDFVLEKLQMMNLDKFQWIGYFHFTGEHEVTFLDFPGFKIRSKLQLENYEY